MTDDALFVHLAGLAWGWALRDTLRLANAVAAPTCRRLGGRAGIPSLAETRRFLEEIGVDLPPVPVRGILGASGSGRPA